MRKVKGKVKFDFKNKMVVLYQKNTQIFVYPESFY